MDDLLSHRVDYSWCRNLRFMARSFDGLSTPTNGFSLGCHDHSGAPVYKVVLSAEN
jgi:hypothetical protein